MAKGREGNSKLALILIVYILGIFMGALDTGVVSPVRTIIQSTLNVNEQTGIWVITIYTLAYAASIPVMGKLADKFGIKRIYLSSVLLFGLGSLFCGLSSQFGSFTLLLISRVVQAVGDGGILPIAIAGFGTSFPHKKRGLVLGLMGSVFGIANVVGSSAGSAIVDALGQQNWPYIFYINIPITIIILIVGFFVLSNKKSDVVGKIDYLGIAALTVMILSLLYGLRNLDFFNFAQSINKTNVYPLLIAFAVLIPLFIFFEKRSQDPVMNLKFFTERNILLTLLTSLISGVVIMGMVFVPQFSENSLKIPSGNGGYFVMILGVFAGVCAPFSGKLIDKFGVKAVLSFGFVVSIIGSMFLAFVAAKSPSAINVVLSLVLIGIGIGFTMGTPGNYMMLDNTDPEESNSALATLSLVRSIGTAVTPAIMVGFLAHAGANVQTNVMALLPRELTLDKLAYVEEIAQSVDAMRNDPQTASVINSIDLPDFEAMSMLPFDLSSDYGTNSEHSVIMKNSDVTTITDNAKQLAGDMFDKKTPTVVREVQGEIQKGVDGINMGLEQLCKANSTLSGGTGVIGNSATKLLTLRDKMITLKDALPQAFEDSKDTYLGAIEEKRSEIEETFQSTLNVGFKNIYFSTSIACALGLILLLFYKKKSKTEI